jgi:hypothetical protein
MLDSAPQEISASEQIELGLSLGDCKKAPHHAIRNNRAAWQRGCLQTTRTSNRAILVTSFRPGNYFNQMFIFKLKLKTNIIGQNMQQTDDSCFANNVV